MVNSTLKKTVLKCKIFNRYTDSLFIAKDENNDDLITSLSLYTKMFGIEAYRAVYDNYIRDERKNPEKGTGNTERTGEQE